jgi:hypothetical protein
MRIDDVELPLEPDYGASGTIFNHFVFIREAPRPLQRRKQFFCQYLAFKSGAGGENFSSSGNRDLYHALK